MQIFITTSFRRTPVVISYGIEVYPLPARVRETINIDEPDNERTALLVSPGGRLRPPRARSRYTMMCLILLIVLAIAISVVLRVTLSAGSEASAKYSPECVPRRRTGSIATQKEMETRQHAPLEGAVGTRRSVPVASTRTGLAIRWTELCPSRVTDTAAQL